MGALERVATALLLVTAVVSIVLSLLVVSDRATHATSPSGVPGHRPRPVARESHSKKTPPQETDLSRLYDELRGSAATKHSLGPKEEEEEDPIKSARHRGTTTTTTTAAAKRRRTGAEKKTNASSCGPEDGDLVALTYASHRGRDDRFCRSLESAIRNGVRLKVLGWGVPWEGLSQKLGAALDAVEAYPPECVVMFTDAYDVLFTESPAAIKRKFDALGAPLVFSGECGCWPHVQRDNGKTCRDSYPPSPTPYRYLNSGSWIGRAGVAARFLKRLKTDIATASSAASSSKMAEFHKLNDQELAAELYFRGDFGPDVVLDHYATLFLPMHAVRDKTLVPDCDPRPHLVETDGVFYNELTRSRPAVYHFNGGGKKHHLDMEKRMWWKQCAEAHALDVTALVRRANLRFHRSVLSFDEVCPRHLDTTRYRADERTCGDAVARTMRQNMAAFFPPEGGGDPPDNFFLELLNASSLGLRDSK